MLLRSGASCLLSFCAPVRRVPLLPTPDGALSSNRPAVFKQTSCTNRPAVFKQINCLPTDQLSSNRPELCTLLLTSYAPAALFSPTLFVHHEAVPQNGISLAEAFRSSATPVPPLARPYTACRYQLDAMGFVWDLSDAPFRQVCAWFWCVYGPSNVPVVPPASCVLSVPPPAW